MSSMNIGDVFGFHTVAQIDSKLFTTESPKAKAKKEFVRFVNVAKIVSYIPIIGTIAAIAKLVSIHRLETHAHTPKQAEVIPYMKLRCWLEIVPVASSLLLIPDLIATIGRNLCVSSKKT